jgi:capsid protein
MATDFKALLPKDVSARIIQSIGEERSAVMRLAGTTPIPAGVESIPIVSVTPEAGFVNAYGGRKPPTTIEWTALVLEAEELAAILAIPNAYLDDAGYPVGDVVEAELAKAFARAFDAAALYGTNAPATYPVGGLTAAAFCEQPAAVATAAGSLDVAFGAVEDNGLEVDGVLGGAGLRGVMRSLMTGLETAERPPSSIYGVDIATTIAWNKALPATPAGNKLALVGAWDHVIVGVREDIDFATSRDGVITDVDGSVTVNAFQDNQTLFKAWMRVGLVVGLPHGADDAAVKPLALATTSAAISLAQEAKATAKK